MLNLNWCGSTNVHISDQEDAFFPDVIFAYLFVAYVCGLKKVSSRIARG
jgi:hypothetical protein